MADWESHREILKGLYLLENKHLKEVMEHMAEHHSFNASKAEYETQFNKWKWRKNLKKSDWRYVSRKIDQRSKAGQKSAVYLNGTMIASGKVKKEISRQVHPNDQYSLCAIPQSPRDVTVCTPPPDNLVSMPGSNIRIAPNKRRRLDDPSLQELSCSKRQHTMAVETQAMPEIVSTAHFFNHGRSRQNSFIRTRKVEAPIVINLKGLPYFQFRDIMRSQDVIKGFEQMLTLDDALAENLVANFWPQSFPIGLGSQIFSAELDWPNLNLDLDSGFDSLIPRSPMQCSQMHLYKPLGTEFLYTGAAYRDMDTLGYLQKASIEVPALLANMPRAEDEDLQVAIDLLLGPPTVKAARYFVEVGVYLSSNNIGWQSKRDQFIRWMLRVVPWSILRSILSSQVPTIQAFAENVLRVATETENIRVVVDLLENGPLRRLVQSSGEMLVTAARTSNAELVNLLLNAGLHPNVTWLHRTPLTEARTVEIAQLLIEAGADMNALGFGNNLTYAPALVLAVTRWDLKLARYLISAGANVNAKGELLGKSVNALVLATDSDQIELFKLLLEKGANVNAVGGLSIINSGRQSNALQAAAEFGNLEFVRLLLEAGANVNAPAYGKDGQTALQAASSKGNIEIVKLLLNSGVKVNDPSNSDVQFPKTVLTTAVEMNNHELVEILLDAGADVNIPSFGYYGCTILEYAKSQPESSNIVSLLLAKGALDTALATNPHRRIELCEAVHKGDLRRVKDLVETGVRIDMEIIESDYFRHFQNGRTILHWALDAGREVNVELFRILVNNIEDINAQNNNTKLAPIFHQAIGTRNTEVVGIMIDAGADVNLASYLDGTPLMVAVRQGNCEMVLLLLSRGVDINAVVRRSYSTTALQASMSLGIKGIDTFRLLLDYGATINAPVAPYYGRSELTWAVEAGEMEDVRHLLELGAEVNTPAVDVGGRTALQAAAELEPTNMGMVQLLLKEGAEINAPAGRRDGITALQAAAIKSHFQIALLFLEAGADVNAPCTSYYYGRTALEGAAYLGRLDIVHLLLNAGADMNLPMHERYVSAAEKARKRGHIVIAEMLEGWEKSEDVQVGKEGVAHGSKGKGGVVELD